MTWLIAGDHSLQVEAFFCRQPDENHAAFYRFLLERNGRLYGVHFAVDRTGDVYLTGRASAGGDHRRRDRPAARLRAHVLGRVVQRGA